MKEKKEKRKLELLEELLTDLHSILIEEEERKGKDSTETHQ